MPYRTMNPGSSAHTHQIVNRSGPLELLRSWTSSLKAGYIANLGTLLHAAWPGKKRRDDSSCGEPTCSAQDSKDHCLTLILASRCSRRRG